MSNVARKQETRVFQLRLDKRKLDRLQNWSTKNGVSSTAVLRILLNDFLKLSDKAKKELIKV